jgi:hypothetical protein
MDNMGHAFLTESDIALSRSPHPTSATGEIVRPDQFMVDQAQVEMLAVGRMTSEALDVTATSNKSRMFGELWRDGTTAELRAVETQVTADIEELFSKYSGALYVRREGPLLGRRVEVRELILIYDINGVPQPLRETIRSMASRLAHERNTAFSFWITFQ